MLTLTGANKKHSRHQREKKNNLFTRPCQISQNYLLDISLNMNLNTGPRKCPRKTFSFDTYNFIPYHLIWSVSKVPCPSILQRRRNKKPVALESIRPVHVLLSRFYLDFSIFYPYIIHILSR